MGAMNALSPYNVKDYGARGDSRKVTDGITNGTVLVRSATAQFSADDVGKRIWGNNRAGGLSLPVTTIASVVDSTTIIVTAGTASTESQVHLVMGTDDSDAIIAANSAAAGCSQPSAVVIPAGGYIYSKRLFDHQFATSRVAPALIGAGSGRTVFFESPAYDYSAIASHSPTFNAEGNATLAQWSGFTVDGCFINRDYIHYAIYWASGPKTFRHDIAVVGFSRVIAAVATAGSIETLSNLTIRYNNAVGIQCNGTPEFLNCYVGDCGTGISTAGCDLFRWTGGVLDESGSASAIFNDCADVLFTDALIYGPSGGVALDLRGTSGLRAVNCNIQPFGQHPNGTAVKIGAAANASFSQCKLTGHGTGWGIDNDGTVYDGGNNECNTKTGTGTITTRTL